MLILKPPVIKSAEVTDKKVYLDRRRFIATAASIVIGGIGGYAFPAPSVAQENRKLEAVRNNTFSMGEDPTNRATATGYTNFYEFSTRKRDVAKKSRHFKTRPWTLTVDGLVKVPKVYDIDTLIRLFPLEERIYRFRCVEAWSMVIPWLGVPLGDFIRNCEPLSKAKFVEFTTHYDPKQMPGQRSGILAWPYIEGLRIDEAMHPLALMVVGMYGEILPNQNGAPIRLAVPWKYGFKSIKSIVRIRLTNRQPKTSWTATNALEYGFYGNVNPNVDHPRWSQAQEMSLGSGSHTMRNTLMFNGYGDQVAHLYRGMDLKRYY